MTGTTFPKQDSEQRSANADRQRMIDWVLDRLGAPSEMLRIDAKKTWDDNYRVNVYCAFPADGCLDDIRITDSFFITVTEDGFVADPPIVHKHG